MKAANYGLVSREKVAGKGGGRYFKAALETIKNGAGGYGFDPAIKLAITAIEVTLPEVVKGDKTVQEVLDTAAALYVKEAKTQGYIK